MNRPLMIVLSIAILLCKSAYAEELQYDPLARNLINAEGESKVSVPVNAFDVSFDFDVEKGSFTEARNDSDRIIKAIDASLKDLGLKNVEMIKGWDIVRQARISLGTKGRKLSNTLVIRVKDFPEGKLQELIASVIDKSLLADGAVALTNIKVYVTEEVENAKKEEVTAQALKELDSKARKTAESLGHKVIGVKRLYSSTNGQAPAENRAYEMDNYARLSAASFISVQKSFNVTTQIADHVEIRASVSGTYQID